jgi:hypothetical protein
MSDKDIVERLRETATAWSHVNICHEAADEIVRLRAANEHLEKLAGAISKGDGDFRTIAKDLPREPKHWPHVGTHE